MYFLQATDILMFFIFVPEKCKTTNLFVHILHAKHFAEFGGMKNHLKYCRTLKVNCKLIHFCF